MLNQYLFNRCRSRHLQEWSVTTSVSKTLKRRVSEYLVVQCNQMVIQTSGE